MRHFIRSRFFYTRMFLADYATISWAIFVVIGVVFASLQIWNFVFCALPFGAYRVCL